MSTIFNVFNNMNEHNRILATEHITEAKLLGHTSGIVAKKIEQCKPKGLSLRSKSDLNIPMNNYSTPLKKDNNKDLFFSKSEVHSKQLLQVPKEFTKTESSELNKEKVFKEPFGTERINKKIFPEPEVLAPYYDPQLELDDIYDVALENEFSNYILNVQDDMDEGFASEAEELSYPEISTLQLSSNFSDDEYGSYGSLGLPEISDDEAPW